MEDRECGLPGGSGDGGSGGENNKKDATIINSGQGVVDQGRDLIFACLNAEAEEMNVERGDGESAHQKSGTC